jgi:hypothetical protein
VKVAALALAGAVGPGRLSGAFQKNGIASQLRMMAI